MNEDLSAAVSTIDQTLAELPPTTVFREACFSPDGSAVAYIVSDGHRYCAVSANGISLVSEHACHLVVSAFGTTTAWCGRIGRLACVAVNGKVGRKCDWVGDPIVSARGTATAYWSMIRTNPPRHTDVYTLVKDEWSSPEYGAPGDIFFRDATDTLIYSVQEPGNAFLVEGELEGPRVDRVLYPQFCKESQSLWYWGRRGNDWFLFRDHEIYGQSADVFTCSSPVCDGARIAYWKQQWHEWSLVVDGTTVHTGDRPPDWISRPVFGTHGHIAYVGAGSGRVFVGVDGEAGEQYDAVGKPVFCLDGSSMAYKARDGDKEFVVVDGKRGRAFDVLWPEEGELSRHLEDEPVFCSAGCCIAHRAARQGSLQCVVVNGEPGPDLDAVTGGPAFGRNHVVVYSGVVRGQEYVFIAGTPSEPFDRVWFPLGTTELSSLCVPAFSPDREKVLFGALKEGRLIWKAMPVSS